MMIGQRKPWETAFPDMAPMSVDTPQFALPPAAPVAPAMAPAMAPAGKPKINWMGVLADALAGAAGQPGQYAQRMERQRQEQSAFERGEQQYQRQRADALSDDERNYQQQVSLKQWDRANPNDDVTRMMDLAGIPADQRPALYGQALQRKINPPTFIPGVGLVQGAGMGAYPAPAAPSAPRPLTDEEMDAGGAGPQTPRRFPSFPY